MDNIERTKSITITLPESVIVELDRIAVAEFRSRSNVIGRILMQTVANTQPKQEMHA